MADAFFTDTKPLCAFRSVTPTTLEIGGADRQIVHMRSDRHQHKGTAVPLTLIKDLPHVLDAPKAILWDSQAKQPTLIYVIEVPGEQRLAKFVVELRDRDKRLQVHAHNWVTSAGLVDRTQLIDPRAYQSIAGTL